MNKKVVYVGLDVDDTQYHGAALNKATGEHLNFKCRPTLKGLLGQLARIRKQFPRHVVSVVYEASYIGFTLQRDLDEKVFHCDVVAPSSIPRQGGKAVKTDRIDAAQLAQFYANDLLTIVQVPELEMERDRDLLRSRQRLMHHREEVRRHLHAALRRNGIHYKAETGHKSHWTKQHHDWLQRTIESQVGSLKVNLRLLYQQLQDIDRSLAEYHQQIEALAQTERYQQPVKALTCYKGIKTVWALTMITEIGDIKRFQHPRQLVSWIGMDIREYSSGGKHNRFGITKHGNRYLRTAFIEANQRGYRSNVVSKEIRLRQAQSPPECVAVATRCLRRLNKKGNRLLLSGKHPNKVKVACAREMVGFVWESLRMAAA
jgi:transposase